MSEIPSAGAPPPEPLPESVALPMFAIALCFLFTISLQTAAVVVEKTGFFGWPEGHTLAALARDKSESPEQKAAATRLGLWATATGFPLYLIGLPVLFRIFGSVSPRSVGLTARHLVRHVANGFKMGLWLIPLVTAVFLLVQWYFKVLAGEAAEPHPYARLARSGLTPVEWIFLFLGAVVVAPINEELLFRGILQRWFLQAPRAGWLGMLAAASFALLLRWQGLKSAWPTGGAAFWWELSPLLFVLVLVPHFLVLTARGKAPALGAIFVSAAVFASVHSFAWPSPVPLLVLGIGLGWLAHRQASLAGSMTVHALFNGVNFGLLLLEGVK